MQEVEANKDHGSNKCKRCEAITVTLADDKQYKKIRDIRNTRRSQLKDQKRGQRSEGTTRVLRSELRSNYITNREKKW